MALTAKQAYALSKKYTDATAEEFGGLKGAPCTIESIIEITNGHRITFSWENSEGETLTDTLDVMNGEEGKGIVSIEPDNDNIVINYTDGTHSDPIPIPTIKGDKGDDGFSPEITVKTSTSTTYILHIKTADDEFDTPNLKGTGVGETDFDIVTTVSQLPSSYTSEDRKMFYVIDEKAFYLWNGEEWTRTLEEVDPLTNIQMDTLKSLI